MFVHKDLLWWIYLASLAFSRPLHGSNKLGTRQSSVSTAQTVIYPDPGQDEPRSTDYTVQINGQPVFVYSTYGFDRNATTEIFGRQITPVSFASFDSDFTQPVQVDIVLNSTSMGFEVEDVVVRPLSWNINPTLQSDSSISFNISEPCQLSIEPNGDLENPLHIFANPLEVDVPDLTDPNVLYFEPGVHIVPAYNLSTSDYTVYIAGGAVVYLEPANSTILQSQTNSTVLDISMYNVPPLFDLWQASNVTIRGRGIICGSMALAAYQRATMIYSQDATSINLEGIIVREAGAWSVNLYESDQIHVDRIKVLGYFVNNDGVVLTATNALVENVFVHNADDTLNVKDFGDYFANNLTFSNNVIWSTVAGALSIPFETSGNISDITFRNTTVIHAYNTPLAIQTTNIGNITNILYENIVIEDMTSNEPFAYIGNTAPADPDVGVGSIFNISFINVNVLSCQNCTMYISGYNSTNTISEVLLSDVVVEDSVVQPESPLIYFNGSFISSTALTISSS